MKMENKNILNSEDDIELLDLFKTVWSKKKIVIRFAILFGLIGLFMAVFSKNRYKASVTIVPQTSSKSSIGANLGGLAAIAGIDLSNMGSESGITPQLYPQVLNSIPLQKELLYTPISFLDNQEKMNYKYYYENVYEPGVLETVKKYTFGLPSILSAFFRTAKIKNKVKKNSVIRVTKQEKALIKQIKTQLHLQVNKKEGYVVLYSEMSNALAAAEFTKLAQDLLEKYIIKFKIQKSKSQLDFIKERYQEKESEFKAVQKKVAIFRDRNQNINSALSQTKLVQLQSEYDLSYAMYGELAKQLEKQQLLVKQDTPVFTIIEPVSVPVEKSGANRFFILFVWVFFGFVISIVFIFFKLYVAKLKKEL